MQDIQELRELLLGDARRELDGLRAELERTRGEFREAQERYANLARDLPVLVREGSRDGSRLADALEQPVGECINRSVDRNPTLFADALYPVMAPAIRRSISETLKGLVQSINQAIDHSLSPRGLRWRIEAWRSGESFAAVVIKHTLIYRVEAAWLIHSPTGLLIAHAAAQNHTTLRDEDAVSAMLTAVQDFMQDAFTGNDERLRTVEIGDRTLMLTRGAHANLACLVSGVPPAELRERFEEVLASVQRQYGSEIAAFSGDTGELEAVGPLLGDALTLAYRDADSATAKSVRWWPWALALALLLAAGGLEKARIERHQALLSEARETIEALPGVNLLSWDDSHQPVRARLLRDPLSSPRPQALLRLAGLDREVRIEETPHASIEAPLPLMRALQLLRPPAGVTAYRAGDALVVEGSAPTAWIDRVNATLFPPPGFGRIDASALKPSNDELLAQARRLLDPPQGVALAQDGARLNISGTAPWSWIERIDERLAALPRIQGCNADDLVIAEVLEAEALQTALAESEVRFTKSTTPSEASEARIETIIAQVERLHALAQSAPIEPRIRITGYSDGLGTEPWNRWLRQRRAEYLAGRLQQRDIPLSMLTLSVDPAFTPTSTPREELRKVEVRARFKALQVAVCHR